MWRLSTNFFSHVIMSHQPLPRISLKEALWEELIRNLRERGGDIRESGAFLLGTADSIERIATRFVLYDDLDPKCLNKGYVQFDGRYYGHLWALCAQASLNVVADVHTHPYGPGQSRLDKTHPMVSIPGHIALIIPNYAQGAISTSDVGVYVYRGRHQWFSFRGQATAKVLNIQSGGEVHEYRYP